MGHNSWNAVGEPLPAATVADACVRLDVTFQLAPSDIRPLTASMWCCGPARTVRHAGSVDLLFDVLDDALPDEIVVIDNAGRSDEACVGELVVLEAAAVGIGGLVVWGCHRDTAGLLAIDLPIFSLGACPVGPRRERDATPAPPRQVTIGSAAVRPGDIVVADSDGVLIIPFEAFHRVLPMARQIQRTEQTQADALANGNPLREQWRFDVYRALRGANPHYTFRDHLCQMRGAIEA